MSEQSRLAALIDGVTLSEEAARKLWLEFSAHMDANEGDLAGFAKLKGWHAVAPEYRHGKAVLVVSTTAEAAAAARPPAPVAKPKPKVAGKPKPKAAPARKGAPARPKRKAGVKPKR